MKICFLVLAILFSTAPTVSADEPARGMEPVPDERVTALQTGRQFLAVIGISRYESWIPLPDAVRDAREVRDILLSRYRVDERRELYDEQATKAAIIRLFEGLQKELKPDDSLLVLYSGHGHLDRKSDTGFWIPVDAGTDVYEQVNWLPHVQLRGLLARMPASHVFVISDSCFAGDLLYATRSLEEGTGTEYLRRSYSLMSRLVLTSGATEPVPAASNFAAQLKSALRRNREPFLDTLVLYNAVRVGMTTTMPLLGALAGAGHQEGASFLLFLKSPETSGRSGAISSVSLPAGGTAREETVWVGGGMGLAVPLLELSNQFYMGPILQSHALYTVRTSVGTFGAAVLAGAGGLQTSNSTASGYFMASFPAALDLRYEAALGSRTYLSADFAVGGVLNQLISNDPGRGGITTVAWYLSPALFAGQRLGERLRAAVGLGGTLTLFHRPLLTFWPAVRVEYALKAPAP